MRTTARALAALTLLTVVATPTRAQEAEGYRSTVSGPVLPTPCQTTRSESFPQLAVHPDDPQRLTATFLSDGTRAVGFATSTDSGRTWDRDGVTPASRCTGGSEDFAFVVNPQLAAGLGGAAYLGNSWLNAVEEPLFRYGVSAHGFDGTAWSSGTSPGRGDYAQNLAMVPDPADPDVVTAVWTHMDQLPVTNLGPLFYAYATAEVLAARSTDGGATFGLPVLVAAEPGHLVVNVRAEATSDGGILAVYDAAPVAALLDQAAGNVEGVELINRAVRSTDGGRTWTSPVDLGARRLLELRDPTTQHGLARRARARRSCTWPSGRTVVPSSCGPSARRREARWPSAS